MQLIGTGHLYTVRFRILMIERQRATPRVCLRFTRFRWTEGDAGWGLAAPIVDRILKLHSPAGAIGPDVEESRIGHGHVRAAGEVRNRFRCYRHTDRSDLQWHMSG